MRSKSTSVTWTRHIERAPVRLVLPDAVPDESLFFLVAVVAGGIVGLLLGGGWAA
jgi:hypothetical protein